MSSALGFLALLVPVCYLVFAAMISQGLRHQPRVALAWTPQRFRDAVAAAGGASAVRAGLWLDVVFVLGYAVTATYLLREGRWWWLPMGAAVLDLAENVVIAWLLNRDASPRDTTTLTALAVLKFLLYGAGLVALGAELWAVVQG